MASATPPDSSGSITSNANSDVAAPAASSPTRPAPVAVAFAVGNTYRRLLPSEASYDRLTGRHLKVHDWTLYVDVLPGQDPDVIDRVTFDMRDNSFATAAFTCHSPIRVRADAGSSFGERATGGDGQNHSRTARAGQSTGEGGDVSSAVAKRPHPSKSRWRFSTRQQTFGAVDVQINIRGRGGCRCTIPYKIILTPGGYECPTGSLPLFVEKRPHQQLKPLKMMDTSFSLTMSFGLESRVATQSCLYETARSVYSRSKIPIRLLSEEGEIIDFENKPNSKPSAKGLPWIVTLVEAACHASRDEAADAAPLISMSSPALSGGHGLNECYKVIEGLPRSCVASEQPSIHASAPAISIHVRIDVSKLSTQQIIKVCQNFVKYEEAMDSFMPRHRREDRCGDCRSIKQAMEGGTNKRRNQRIAACKSPEELTDCLNPVGGREYKLNLRGLVGADGARREEPPWPQSHAEHRCIEFRQHPSSKDRTAATHWVRFCTAFVRNSARLRPPSALRATTSIEEEFDLLFEYVVKDRALRNYYRGRRDAWEAAKEGASGSKANGSLDSVGVSGGGDDDACSVRKRSDGSDELECKKRACLKSDS